MPSAAEILEPILVKFDEAMKTLDAAKVAQFYDENCALVMKGAKCTYGRKELETSLAEWFTKSGKMENQISNKKFEGSDLFLIIDADYHTVSELAGEFKGHFYQVWRKTEQGGYLIVHEEFSL